MRPVPNLGSADSSARSPGARTSRRRNWRTTYLRRLIAVDAASAIAAASSTMLLIQRPSAQPALLLVVVLSMALLWVGSLALTGAYELRLLEHGPQSSRRVGCAAVLLVVASGTVSWALQVTIPRGFVLSAVLVACALTLAQRHWHRAWLHRRRAEGECVHTTLLVGDPDAVAFLQEQLRHGTHHGHRIVGCCLPTTDQRRFDGMPVLGDLSRVRELADLHQVDTVAVGPAPELDGHALHRLAGELMSSRVQLLMAPSLADAAGPRVRSRPSWVLPLLHADRPDLRRGRRVVTAAGHRGAALLALVVTLPVLVAIAVAIKVTSAGAVLVRHPQVGTSGHVFHRMRFRTTVTGPDSAARPRGPHAIGGDGPHLRSGEPTTAVGRFLSRHCLDELPQVVNVLRGEMSLVPRRPPVPGHADRYTAT